MPTSKERLELERGISKYLSKHQRSGEAYEFNIKIRKINIPDEVREKFSEAQIQDMYEFAASQSLKDFMDNLNHDFPWIHEWRQDGRSGGWLVIEPDAAVFDGYGNIENVRFAKKRLSDLDKIAARVMGAKSAFANSMQSDEWWGIHPKKKNPWRPRAEKRKE